MGCREDTYGHFKLYYAIQLPYSKKIASRPFPKFQVIMLLQYLQGAEVVTGREE